MFNNLKGFIMVTLKDNTYACKGGNSVKNVSASLINKGIVLKGRREENNFFPL